jgi:2-polyprenyl-6-methoxyphenol hydroxylase-like FAD-dependent oxidoreductase
MYDVIVVGARCAGSPTAMLLARRGYRVLLVDKATFPSDTMSGHYVQSAGVGRLEHWGLLDRVRASNCPPISKITLSVGDLTFSPPPPEEQGMLPGFCPRRTLLDKILVDAAVEAGAELRQGFSVRGLVWDGGRVSGIQGVKKGQSAVTEESRIIIGADGIHSFVARSVQAPQYNERPALSFGYYTYWSGIPVDGNRFYFRDGIVIGVLPTNDDWTLIFYQRPIAEFHECRKDVEGSYMKTIGRVPELAAEVRHARREARFLGTADLENFFRKPYGPGWALAGDAGYHKDPITALGIMDAFRDAELLADAIDAGFSGRRPLDDALGAYEQQRNDASVALYENTCQQAMLEGLPSPQVMMDFGLGLARAWADL